MKCKITLGDVMEIKQDKRRFDFHDIGLAIKRAQARKNACWGAPQARCTSGQIVPKSGAMRPSSAACRYRSWALR